jgi:hypothetical protein
VLTWISHHLDSHISEAMVLMRDLSDTVGIIKSNAKATLAILAAWERCPCFERKDGKVGTCKPTGRTLSCMACRSKHLVRI